MKSLGLGNLVQNESATVYALGESGRIAPISGPVDRTVFGINEVNRSDGQGYLRYREFMRRIRPVISRFLTERPLNLLAVEREAPMELLTRALGLRLLGSHDMVELLRVAPMPVSDFLNEYFESEEFDVRVAYDGAKALEMARQPGLDLMVLDIMMPEMNGMDVLKELRHTSRLPVIMLTARGDDMDRILGLELGADDYVPKPCNPRELLARIRAVMRRAPTVQEVEHNTITTDDLELNQGNRTLAKSGEMVELTSTEFSILQLLLQRSGEVVEKKDLYLAALGREPVAYDRSIDMHVSNLRRKLGPANNGAERIETIRGIGYQYCVGVQNSSNGIV